MLGRVAGSLDRSQVELADRDLVAFGDLAMGEPVAGRGGPDDLRTGGVAELDGARDVVVVDMRLQDGRDLRALRPCSVEVAIHVALRIDHQGLAAGGQHVAVVPQPGRDQHLELHAIPHRTARHLPCASRGPRRNPIPDRGGLPDRAPHPFGGERHVDVADAEVRHRVDHRVLHRRG